MNIQTIGDFRDTIKPLLIDMKVIRKIDVIDKNKPRLILNYVKNKNKNKLWYSYGICMYILSNLNKKYTFSCILLNIKF